MRVPMTKAEIELGEADGIWEYDESSMSLSKENYNNFGEDGWEDDVTYHDDREGWVLLSDSTGVGQRKETFKTLAGAIHIFRPKVSLEEALTMYRQSSLD